MTTFLASARYFYSLGMSLWPAFSKNLVNLLMGQFLVRYSLRSASVRYSAELSEVEWSPTLYVMNYKK